jgi:hypothetical protein
MRKSPGGQTVTNWRQKLRAGDWVQVRSAAEILSSLDDNGTLDGLPFMPEMLPCCGRTFRVARRAEKTCVEVAPGQIPMRAFRHNDVVLLEGLRCSGVDHGGCQRGCMLFWKEAWLRRVADIADLQAGSTQDEAALRTRLRTQADGTRFICQSTELQRATVKMSQFQRLQKCLEAVWSGSRGPLEMFVLISVAFWSKLRRWFRPTTPQGNQKSTPTEALGLRPGELVEVKPVSEILATLDAKGRNRGLQFDLLLNSYCRRQYRVRQRLDRMIMESSGEMRSVQNTVTLEGTTCLCAYVAVGGCPRQELVYWREIWLKRVDVHSSSRTRLREE